MKKGHNRRKAYLDHAVRLVDGVEDVRQPGLVLVLQPVLLQVEDHVVDVGHDQRDLLDGGLHLQGLHRLAHTPHTQRLVKISDLHGEHLTILYKVSCTDGEYTPLSAGPAKVRISAVSMLLYTYSTTHPLYYYLYR